MTISTCVDKVHTSKWILQSDAFFSRLEKSFLVTLFIS